MSSVVRKISIGSDYKNDAMHYSVGQNVYGGHTIDCILHDVQSNSYSICHGRSLILTWQYPLSMI